VTAGSFTGTLLRVACGALASLLYGFGDLMAESKWGGRVVVGVMLAVAVVLVIVMVD
jgi:hypothetical protein